MTNQIPLRDIIGAGEVLGGGAGEAAEDLGLDEVSQAENRTIPAFEPADAKSKCKWGTSIIAGHLRAARSCGQPQWEKGAAFFK